MDPSGILVDDAYHAFLSLYAVADAAKDVNEDTTRVRLIDTVLFDVLKWDRHTEVDTEHHVPFEGFADYVFTRRGHRSLVLEAKRIGATFTLPNRSYPSRAVSFSLIADQCPAALKAMQQAVGYSTSLGTRYTAISNGRQWLFMLTSVEGVLLQERNVLVFESLEAIRDRFPMFWDTFAPVSIGTNLPHASLVDGRSIPPPAKLKVSIPNYPVPRSADALRNRHATAIQLIWDEINASEGTTAFFKECYVLPSSADKNENIAKELIVQRSELDKAMRLMLETQSSVTSMVTESYKPEKALVLLGRIGRGKSTFIKYLKTVVAPHELERYIQLDVDFIEKTRDRQEVGDYVYSEIGRQLDDRYKIDIGDDKFVRAVLHGAINKYKKGPRATAYANDPSKYLEAEIEFIETQTRDKYAYIVRCFQHLKGNQRQSIAVFFDNLDKRLYPIQEEAFLIASSLARDCGALIFVCLRPGTFYRSKRDGVLDSIAPRIIQIHPPQLAVFLRRRFEYAAAIAAGKKQPPRGEAAVLSKAIAAQGIEVSKLFHSLAQSVRQNKALIEIFESVSNGNLREVLSYVGGVITSGHLNTGEMLNAIEDSGGYTVAEHHALRAILFGDAHYYEPERPPFINLFDLTHADPVEHFIRPACLHHLSQVSEASATSGFIPFDELAAKLSPYMFCQSLIEDTVAFLYQRKCIEDEGQGDEFPGTTANFRITGLGRYHLHHLMKKFLYLDAMAPDIPVLSDDARRDIRDVEPVRDRLKRAEVMLRYLNRCAEQLRNTSFFTHWDQVQQEIFADIEEVEMRSR